MVVETLESPQQIIIPPGTASNTILNLERKGCYKLGNKSYRGNHYVHLQIKPPKTLTDRQKAAIIEFAKDEDFAGTVDADLTEKSELEKEPRNEEPKEEKGFFKKMKEKVCE